jgi:hypothetical protein
VYLVIYVVPNSVQFKLLFHLKMLLCNLVSDLAWDFLFKGNKLSRYSSLVLVNKFGLFQDRVKPLKKSLRVFSKFNLTFSCYRTHRCPFKMLVIMSLSPRCHMISLVLKAGLFFYCLDQILSIINDFVIYFISKDIRPRQSELPRLFFPNTLEKSFQ